MEEDEEVVLEGGSLHQHLDAIGFQDYEVMPSQNKAEGNSKILPNHFMKNILKVNISKVGSFKWMIEAFIGVHHVEASFLECVCSKVINSKLLEEEDLLILETMSPTIQQFSTNPQHLLEDPTKLDQPSTNFYQPSSCFVWKNLKWWVCGFIFNPLAASHFTDVTNGTSTLLKDHLGVSCDFLFLHHFYCFNCVLNELQSTLNNLEETLTIMGRCNRVINRSCKFFNEMSSIRKIIQHAPNSLGSWEGCHDSSLFKGSSQLLESVSSLLISSHLQLVNSRISSGNNIHSLFSDVFKKSFDSDTDCGRDEYSVLKNRRNLTFLHISSFLTELFLCYEASKDITLFKLTLPHVWVHIKSSISFLERTLKLCDKYRLQEEPIFKEVIKPSKSFEKLKFDVKGAVDNLSVHCKLIAYSVLHLKDSLELAEDPLSPEFHQIIKDACEKLQNEIVSCSACLEDVVEKNDNYFDCKLEKSERQCLPSFSGLKEDECETHPTSELEVCGISDPVIEDEVFEIINYEKPDCNGNSKDDDWVENTKRERQVRKKQRERCKRVLQEIQPILQKRREMWHERELEALKRMEVTRGKVSLDSLPSPHLMDSGINSPVATSIFPEISEDKGCCFSVPDEISKLPCNNNEVKNEAVCQKILQTNFEEEIDSEEENLAVYRRVKEELDRDEARRREENSSSDESDSDLEAGVSTGKGCTATPKDLFHITPPMPVSILTRPGAKSSSIKNINLPQNSDSNRVEWFTGSPREIKEGFHVAPRLGSEQFEGEASQRPRTTSDSPDSSSSRTSIKNLSWETDCMEKEATLPLNGQREGKTFQSEAQFLCGSSDEEEKCLDWSSCGFSLQREREEKGDNLFSGLPLVLEGFKVSPQLGKEEVFGGVGEGESEESS